MGGAPTPDPFPARPLRDLPPLWRAIGQIIAEPGEDRWPAQGGAWVGAKNRTAFAGRSYPVRLVRTYLVDGMAILPAVEEAAWTAMPCARWIPPTVGSGRTTSVNHG
jgi:hypothetical protein